MVRTRQLKRGEVTYSWAKEEKANMLIALEDNDQTNHQLAHLYRHSALVEQLAAHHLNSAVVRILSRSWLSATALMIGITGHLSHANPSHVFGNGLSAGAALEIAVDAGVTLCYFMLMFRSAGAAAMMMIPWGSANEIIWITLVGLVCGAGPAKCHCKCGKSALAGEALSSG
ncbi:hypothetical protein I7I51_03451 [Histoplasma capsulatum]|uniref:Uncharacterized protein n=1 Tax=Ajellomyces capsulatus TaxID=5037 RepID=A0A8A1M484_AJECA|nr:hypothetical protein I7I51_03451 [Histoplasma capsulatum]